MSLTRQEVFQALADGKEVECKSIHAAHICAFNPIAYSALEPDKFGNYYWRIKPEEPKWYENIPEHGVLCFVSDTDEKPYDLCRLAIIIKYCKGELTFLEINYSMWRYATPLTNDEIKQFLRGE